MKQKLTTNVFVNICFIFCYSKDADNGEVTNTCNDLGQTTPLLRAAPSSQPHVTVTPLPP